MPKTYICSIFLPYTIDFHLDEDESAVESTPSTAGLTATHARRDSMRLHNLLSELSVSRTQSRHGTPPMTPQHELLNEYFDLNPRARPLSRTTTGTMLSSGVRSNLAIASPSVRSGRASPVFTQPRSRANSPPPSLNGSDSNRFGAPGIGATLRPLRKRRESLSRSVTLFDKARWTVELSLTGNGGLYNAIHAAKRDNVLDNSVWIGLLGFPTETLSDKTKQAISAALLVKHQSIAVYTSDSNYEGHYNHYCKKILWPAFHYQHNETFSFFHEESSWDAYVAVNQAFADKIIQTYKPGDVVWVNDYHLLLVPEMVRKRVPNAIIGLFIHVSFPSSEVFRCFARRKELLTGMLGANLVGFQTDEYKRHFLQTCARIMYVEAMGNRLLLEDRYVDVNSFPIGIDPILLSDFLNDPDTTETYNILAERYKNLNVFFGRDKMDNIKGIREKLLAYEQFLDDNPTYQSNTVLLQVALMEDDREYSVSIADIVARINSKYSDFSSDHLPVVIVSRDLNFAQFLALLKVADAFVVTSLREGFNLTCHEFIYAQQEKRAPLIISEFAGSASILSDSALIVNPWSTLETSLAFKTALELSDNDRERLFNGSFKAIMKHNATTWVADFTSSLKACYAAQEARDVLAIPRFSSVTFTQNFERSKHRLFILDFEGTTINWGSAHQFVSFNYKYMLDIIAKLCSDPRNTVYITSSLGRDELEGFFLRLPDVGLICGNGCFVRPHAQAEGIPDMWLRMFKPEDMTWRSSVKELLDYYRERTPGSTVEDRGFSFSFNYKNAEDEANAMRSAGELCSSLNEGASNGCRAVPLEGEVICEPSNINKATASEYVYKKLCKDPDSIDLTVVAGNDRTDEPNFEWANTLKMDTITISMDKKHTEAKCFAEGVSNLLHTLDKICNI
ncbi:alpha,alpha-trehalose-phosphate synthase [Schizosaccharomyces japonicus yFS275]|uniref:Alpha,alpha-trehalose-phosphate synthase n=1 Tax=Schizosaccharomyces japonicus (strain yFS275 / FY16936) TaxID=402676 RepID=B6JXI8_SCHJY|nr:alpha,alpha-trehalose-phosphate synthase [Schizosaccharomyces japonicus yFS275]EEB05132.1 alpha,alpha-trehalose-phosphate synthase [Schizosaccharomyces japonicus yFS275]